MKIPFTKAHGGGNDFLFTFAAELPFPLPDGRCSAAARALCHRNTGIGGDGWYLIEEKVEGADARVRLWNSDGSKAELSGNGTRCAAEILARNSGKKPGDSLGILTGAGLKRLRIEKQEDTVGWFEMDMGPARVTAARHTLALRSGPLDVTLIDVGNPQCALEVAGFDFDWTALGREIEGHPAFPDRTNVSFLRRIDEHTIQARFFERGAGHTLSSGTGATGAAVAALVRGLVSTPVTVETEFGSLYIRLEPGLHCFLTGPAEIIARGLFFWSE